MINSNKNVFDKSLLVFLMIIILSSICVTQSGAKVNAQHITLIDDNITIGKVFKEIKRQSGFDVLWQSNQLNTNKILKVNFVDSSIDDVMSACLIDFDLNYSMDDRSIIIKKNEYVKPVFKLLSDSLLYSGKIYDERGKPMGGASVKIKESNKVGFTSADGSFSIYGPTKGSTLLVTYVGYVSNEISLNRTLIGKSIIVLMKPGQNQLGEVNIVSNGYQDLPKERSTGSFEVISKEQLQHSNDPNLIKRLEGIVTGVDFRNNLTATNSANQTLGISPVANITIRGKNTLEVGNNALNTSGQALVIIDGIASPYGIEQVNPEDVENITILRDAASASIWGSRAANGVIVVKTKRGAFNLPTSVSFTSNFNISDKMNLFYKKYMSTSEFIDAEIYKFRTAKTNLPAVTINNPRLLVSPVSEIMDAWINKNTLTESQANNQINALRNNDLRYDYDKYLLRKAYTQNYTLAIDGGSNKATYRLSGGYSKIVNNTVESGSDRYNISYNTSVRPLKGLEFSANVNYNQLNTNSQSTRNRLTADYGGAPFYPYVKLADNSGNPLTVNWNYRQSFIDLLNNTYGDKILDLSRKPLDEVFNGGYSLTKSQSININLNAIYKIINPLSLSLSYSPNWTLLEQTDLQREGSFFMRNLINRYTDRITLQRNIPLGDLYLTQQSKQNNETLRGQMSFDKTWSEKHSLNMILGIDMSQSYIKMGGSQYFGYNERTLSTAVDINYKDAISLLFLDPINGQTRAKIPNYKLSLVDYKNRSIGVFTNLGYTYDRRYTLTASLRNDQNSDFGAGTNSKGSPFYSLGLGWSINNEKFYNFASIPILKLRATFGYNGNVNPSATAIPLLNKIPASDVDYGNFLGYAYTFSPSNAKLRPERTGILNLGLDWSIKNSRLSGSIEYYNKKTKDLISENPVDPSSGFIAPSINNGDLRAEGLDFSLSSLNLQTGMFRWNSNFLFSYNRVKVTKIYSSITLNAGSVVTNPYAYSVGYDLGRLFAFKWAGLDPLTGDPRGYLNDQVVTISNGAEGNKILNDISNASPSTAHFFGSAVPVYFGSVRNTFSYGNLSVSLNLLYKLGYWFKRPTSDIVAYDALYRNGSLQGQEYSFRWQHPGDENITNVPSAIYPANPYRDVFYRNAEINVQKADHVRLQEINVSYSIKTTSKNVFKSLRLYCNINNLGIIWRANKLGLDPDIYDLPVPKTYSLGFSAMF